MQKNRKKYLCLGIIYIDVIISSGPIFACASAKEIQLAPHCQHFVATPRKKLKLKMSDEDKKRKEKKKEKK
jgi:hypothetical protein